MSVLPIEENLDPKTLLNLLEQLKNKRIGSIDFGTKKIGLAISDSTLFIATPFITYKRKDLEYDLNYINDFVQKNNIGLLVVGYPTKLTGGNHNTRLTIRDFATKIKNKTECNIYLQDESFSTRDAIYMLRQHGVSRKKTKSIDDMVSAAVILQRTLDQLHSLDKLEHQKPHNNEIKMKKIQENLYVGSQEDFFDLSDSKEWAFVQAAREPFFLKEHRQKYIDPENEPLFIIKENLIALNFSNSNDKTLEEMKKMIDQAMIFIDRQIEDGKKVLIHCNHGISRSPSVALMYLIKKSKKLQTKKLNDIIAEYSVIYPPYSPTKIVLNLLKQLLLQK